jgi:broad specificity phosphatase PhoE
MGNLYLVRHGQASFGAADYDNLSELGHRQSVRLGEYFASRQVHFDAVMTGTNATGKPGRASRKVPAWTCSPCSGPASTSTAAKP